MDALLQDLRYGIRQLQRQPGSSIVAAVTLALGIGASTAIFSVVDSALLRPLPYPEPERLVEVNVAMTEPDGRVFMPSPAMADLRLWQKADEGVFKRRGLGSSVPRQHRPRIRPHADVNEAMMVVVRPSNRIPALSERLRQTAKSIGPRVLVERIRSANDWFGDRVVTPRRQMVLLSLLGGLGLVLALVGIFGTTAYAVSQRTAEIGVRMALGARPGQVVKTILRDSAVAIALGTALGLGGAGLVTRVMESFLFETTPTDAMTFAAVALTLMGAGGAAALIPALKAARVDPVATLRPE